MSHKCKLRLLSLWGQNASLHPSQSDPAPQPRHHPACQHRMGAQRQNGCVCVCVTVAPSVSVLSSFGTLPAGPESVLGQRSRVKLGRGLLRATQAVEGKVGKLCP